MGLKIFSQLAFGAVCMLIGQISIHGVTIGQRFVNELMRAGEWTIVEVRRVQLIEDVLGIKKAAEKNVGRAKEVQESIQETIDEKIERLRKLEPVLAGASDDAKNFVGNIEKQLGRMKKEALAPQNSANQDLADDELDDEELKESPPGPAVSNVDQDAILKNLP